MKYSDHNGFTLIELMIAMVIGSIVMAAVVGAYQIQVRSKNAQEAITDINSSARAALEIMTSELSAAGCDPEGTAGAGIITAEVDNLIFSMDIGNTAGTSFQPDGLLDGPNEIVRYALIAGTLGRATGAAGVLQPLVRNVDVLDFVYLNEAGGIAATLATIRAVEVSIVARSGQGSLGSRMRTVDNTSYPNLQNVEILAPPNDSIRRVLLTTSVNCRNLGVGP